MNDGQRAKHGESLLAVQKEARKALNALALELPSEVWDDANEKISAVLLQHENLAEASASVIEALRPGDELPVRLGEALAALREAVNG